MQGYRRFLAETPETAMTPEAMRRLADLQLEKQFGIRTGDGKAEGDGRLAARADLSAVLEAEKPVRPRRPPARGNPTRISERRTTAESALQAGGDAGAGDAGAADPKGPLEAIALYEKLLAEYPSYQDSDKGPLSDVAGLRRARPDRRGDATMER